jgi:hypothetical protein
MCVMNDPHIIAYQYPSSWGMSSPLLQFSQMSEQVTKSFRLDVVANVFPVFHTNLEFTYFFRRVGDVGGLGVFLFN